MQQTEKARSLRSVQLSAGRELNALVQEKVFGATWRAVADEDFVPEDCTHVLVSPWGARYAERKASGDVFYLHVQPYSELIEVAWLVVEKMRERDAMYFEMERNSVRGAPWRVSFSDLEGVAVGFGDTPALAICLAALKACKAVSPSEAQATDSAVAASAVGGSL